MYETNAQRQTRDAQSDLNIAANLLVDAMICRKRDDDAGAVDATRTVGNRLAHASRVLGTTLDEVDALVQETLAMRRRLCPTVDALFASPSTEGESDPTIRVGTCGHMTDVYSAYYPLCSNCGFKAENSPSAEGETCEDCYGHGNARQFDGECPTCEGTGLAKRLRVLALGALAFIAFTTPASAADMHQCYQSGHTGEGFPVITCPFEGTRYYIDLDGVDGSLGTEGDGRWVEMR